MTDPTPVAHEETHRLDEAAEVARARTGHAATSATGAVVGRGFGGLLILASLFVLFGPLLFAPFTLALRAFEGLVPRGAAWQWIGALGVGLGVLGVQFWLALQRTLAIRIPTVVIFSFIWAVTVWLFFTPVPSEAAFGPLPPFWERISRTGWIVVALITAFYSGLYLFLLHRLDERPWARRLQILGGPPR